MIDYTIITSSLAGLDFLGMFARAIIEGVGIIGLGIIVFTLVLKAITLPFDIYQRYKSRKQNLIMRGMKDELEKLQKQYANDKTTYNQKMTELYKKNGYSMFGACLPSLLSIIILIVAFQGFNSYSRYANVKQFVDMTEQFNEVVLGHATHGDDYYLSFEEAEDGFILPLSLADIESKEAWTYTDEEGVTYTVSYKTEGEQEIKDESGNTVATVNSEVVRLYVTSSGEDVFLHYSYLLGSFVSNYDAEAEGKVATQFSPVAKENIKRDYYIDLDAFMAYLEGEAATDEGAAHTLASINEKLPAEGGQPSQEVKDLCTGYIDALGANAARNYYLGYQCTVCGKVMAKEDYEKALEENREAVCTGEKDNPSYDPGAAEGEASQKKIPCGSPLTSYKDHKMSFLWIQNVWESDATYRHPVPASTPDQNAIKTADYDRLTAALGDQKTAYNGYYILIILSIGMMVLSQFITMRSQKETNQYQTADGQGATTQKFMLVLMPLLYGVFAFMYSAAFSIYMIISSFVSLAVTLICNLVLNRIFKKKEDDAIREKYGRKLAWKEKEGENKKKNKKTRE